MLSKVKSKKQRIRLQSRQSAWAAMSAASKIGKSGRYSFTRPGSNKK